MIKYYIILVLAVFGILFSVRVSEKNIYHPPRLLPPKILNQFTLGFRELIADVLWLRLIQDFEYCKPQSAALRENEEDLSEKEKINDDPDSLKGPKCERGWVYSMADMITDLSPRFRIVYSSAATIMSVLVDDREGSRLLFEKALRQFPKDWNLAYRAGYHYMAEVKNLSRAAELFLVAERNGAPPWVAALAARLYSKEGQAKIAYSVIKEWFEEHPEMKESPRYKMLMKSLKKDFEELRKKGVEVPEE